MPRTMTARASVADDGTLPKDTRRLLRGELQLYAGREVEIRVSPPTRSTSANAYYWGVVLRAVQTGWSDAGVALSSDQWHEIFKHRHLAWGVEEINGREVPVPPSTRRLSTTEFHEYLERIRYDEEFVVGPEIEIPEPA